MGYIEFLKRLDRQVSFKNKHNSLRRIEVNLKEHATFCIFVYRKPFRVIQFFKRWIIGDASNRSDHWSVPVQECRPAAGLPTSGTCFTLRPCRQALSPEVNMNTMPRASLHAIDIRDSPIVVWSEALCIPNNLPVKSPRASFRPTELPKPISLPIAELIGNQSKFANPFFSFQSD